LGSATLTLGGTAIATSYAGVIGGTGGLTMNATGTQTLTGSSTYTGPTNVTAGELRVNGNNIAATGAVTVSGTGMLSGNGTVGGATTVQTGGTLTAGTVSSIGTLTVNNNVTMQAGSNLLWKFAAGTPTGDVTPVANGFSDTGSSKDLLAISGGVYTLTAAGLLTSAPEFSAYITAGGDVSLSASGNNVYLNLTPVPEPTTVLGLAAAGMGLAGMIRRRFRRSKVA